MTLASTIDLPDVTNIREPTDTPRPFTVSLLKSIPEQTQCENYMKNAKIAFGSEDFDAKVDRIVIKGPHGTNVKRICYNLPNVAKFGVCMTKHPDSPQHWGFCSRSCSGRENVDGMVYEEASFILHEFVADRRDLQGNIDTREWYNRKSPTPMVEIIVRLFVI